VPAPVVNDHAVLLTRAAASSAQVFCAAGTEPEAKGLALEVEPLQEAVFR